MRIHLKTPAKVVIFALIVALVGSGVFVAYKKGLIKVEDKKVVDTGAKDGAKDVTKVDNTKVGETTVNVATTKPDTNTLNISLDEWFGWKNILDANGGLETVKGSIFDELGLDVNIHIINDATQSSTAVIKGDLDSAGYTVNRTAFLSAKFQEAGVPIVMPYVTNYSNGGDGIIASSKFQTVESLVDAKIGVPQFSEAHSLVVWFVNQSDLADDAKAKIISNLIFFASPDEAAKAFFAGQIDVAATWQPYLTQAQNTSDCHILFSTKSSSRVIMSGIVFRDDYAKTNPEVVAKFIEGTLKASDMYKTDFKSIKDTMPIFAGMSDEDLGFVADDAKLTTWKDNIDILKEYGPTMFTDMCNVWRSVGEKANIDIATSLFDSTYMNTLQAKFETIKPVEKKTYVTDDNKQAIINSQALLSKSATVNYIPDTAKFTDNAEAAVSLDEFIKIAKSLDGSIIQIEGNISDTKETEGGTKLSLQRANSVMQYFITNGIAADRIIVIGNGASKPIAANDTEDNKKLNRRTDFFFKTLEQ